LSKFGIKNQVESSGNWDQNPEIGWLSSDFWLIWDWRRSNWRTRILELNQLKTNRLESVEKNWIAAFWFVQNLKWALLYKRWKRIKRQPITMATHKLGKNLRLKNQKRKSATAAKARLRHFRLLLPALVLVKSNEKSKFRIPACA
jgi:hypothetical protein